jgi:hypothetical protein
MGNFKKIIKHALLKLHTGRSPFSESQLKEEELEKYILMICTRKGEFNIKTVQEEINEF